MKRSILTEMLSQSEHIRGLIQQSAASITSANAGMQHLFAKSALPSGVSQVLDQQSAAMGQLQETVQRLTVLSEVLQGEIRERSLLDHQLAAAFEQEESSRSAALHDQLTGLSNRVLFHDRLEHGIVQATRHGGDEFLCLLTPLHEKKHIAMIAAKLLTAIQAPCEVSGRDGLVSLWVGGSIGISVFPKDGGSAAELIRHADAAMYVAKENRSGFAFAP